LYFSCCIAAAGGIGGGGLNLPILLYIIKKGYRYVLLLAHLFVLTLSLSTLSSDAVILSLCTVLGNYVAQTSLNYKKYHPYCKRRPLIYWDVVLVLLPAQLAGSHIGVLLSQILPQTMLIVLALLVTVYALIKTYRKGMTYYNKESETLLNQPLIGNNDYNDDFAKSGNKSLEINVFKLNLSVANDENEVKLEVILAYYLFNSLLTYFFVYIQWPLMTLRVLFCIWIVYVVFYVVMKNFVASCSAGYFATLGLLYIPLVLTIWWSVHHIISRQRNDPESILTGIVSL